MVEFYAYIYKIYRYYRPLDIRRDAFMNNFVILADVTCDLSEELRNYCGVEDYVKGHIHFSDGRDFQTTLDWSNVGCEEFYAFLSKKSNEVSTAPGSPEEYYLIFKKYAEAGCDVLSMSISSKISSTYGVATVAAERVKKEYPDWKVYCFDSYRMSAAFGLLTAYAHLLKKEGKSFDEIVAWLEENKLKVHQIGPIDDLMFVARRGRISKGKAIMGSFAGVKPMGDCNREGYVTVLTKVKGIKKALDVSASYVEKLAVNIKDQIVIVAHSDRREYATTLAEKLQARLKPKKVFITDVFCACGTNVGPGMVGVYFIGDTVSEDLQKEKDTIENIIKEAK